MDIEAENTRFDLNTVTRLQQMKTGALISASVEAGAILGRLPPEGRVGLRGYAHDLGLAFQIADDGLDVTATTDELGKTAGKDLAFGKSTYPALLGVEGAEGGAGRGRGPRRRAAAAVVGPHLNGGDQAVGENRRRAEHGLHFGRRDVGGNLRRLPTLSRDVGLREQDGRGQPDGDETAARTTDWAAEGAGGGKDHEL